MPRMPKMTMEWDDMGMNPPKKMKEPKYTEVFKILKIEENCKIN